MAVSDLSMDTKLLDYYTTSGQPSFARELETKRVKSLQLLKSVKTATTPRNSKNQKKGGSTVKPLWQGISR